MGFFTFLGVSVLFYYLIVFILYAILDSDLELFIKKHIGKPIITLNGKVVWITGASSGIGKSLAIELAKNGVKLCISARRVQELETVKQECLSKSKLKPNDILIMQMDMIKIKDQNHCFEYVLNYFGRIDILVNNAGRSQRAEWQKIELNVDKELFELNVFSTVNLSRIYARYVERKKIDGHIVVTSSVAGLIGIPNSSSYAAAKHALHGYFETLQLEMKQMYVTLFCPGPIQTESLVNSYTGQQGQLYGKHSIDVKKMTAERCAKLMVIAMVNKLEINFVGPRPIPLMIYISLYYPLLKKFIFKILSYVNGITNLRVYQ